MKDYTVIGVYDDNGQVFAGGYKAASSLDAMIAAAKEAVENYNGGNLQILCAFEYAGAVDTPSDVGTGSYACDLADLDDDED